MQSVLLTMGLKMPETCWDNHHHWLDCLWWTLAFLRNFAHSSLLRAAFFHLLTPRICVSWSTPLSHRNFGLPTLLVPFGLVLNIFLRVLSSLIRIRCPAHDSLLTLYRRSMAWALLDSWALSFIGGAWIQYPNFGSYDVARAGVVLGEGLCYKLPPCRIDSSKVKGWL